MAQNYHITAIIPARFKSTRLPEKLFKQIGPKCVLQHVYDNAVATELFNEVIIACDKESAERISFDCKYVITSDDHPNGTQRIGEVAKEIETDIVVNIQGDEPFINKDILNPLIKLLKSGSAIATLRKKIEDGDRLFDYNQVKVVTDKNQKALYFSRQAIPAHRDLPYREWHAHQDYYAHIGIYGFQKDVLLKLLELDSSHLAEAESLEQLNWLYHGYEIHCAETKQSSIGIDSEEDLQRAIAYYENELS